MAAMKKENHIILGIHITDRLKKAVEVQKLFSQFGKFIKTRLGLHEVGEGNGSPSGVVLIEFSGSATEATAFSGKLSKISGVEVKKIVFTH